MERITPRRYADGVTTRARITLALLLGFGVGSAAPAHAEKRTKRITFAGVVVLNLNQGGASFATRARGAIRSLTQTLRRTDRLAVIYPGRHADNHRTTALERPPTRILPALAGVDGKTFVYMDRVTALRAAAKILVPAKATKKRVFVFTSYVAKHREHSELVTLRKAGIGVTYFLLNSAVARHKVSFPDRRYDLKGASFVWQYWDGVTAVVSQHFRNGTPIKTWRSWHPDGSNKSIESFRNGKRHGVYKRFALGGKLIEQGRYVAGKRAGTWRTWTNEGVARTAGAFKNGRRHGRWDHFETKGKLRTRYRYDKGVVVETHWF